MLKQVGLIGPFQGVRSLLVSSIERIDYGVTEYDSVDQFADALKNHNVDAFIIFIDFTDACSNTIKQISSLLSNQTDFSTVLLHDPTRDNDIEEIDEVVDYDFSLPITEKQLQLILIRAARLSITRRKLTNAKRMDAESCLVEAFLGRSEKAKETRALLKKVATVPISSSFITGETGTGKGLAARILHHNDQYQDGELVAVNCAAIPSDLLESALFGHEAGAFTGAQKLHRGYLEQANDGTLFLDEITEMDIDLQSKLLKAIEERKFRRVGGSREIKVNISVIAATNRDLQEAVHEGKLREDLYHRLGVVCINLPTLRSRKEDLLDLVPAIINEYNLKAKKRVNTIEDSTWNKLNNYDWPGNVRELRNVIERCVLFAECEVFPEEWILLDCSGEELNKEHVSRLEERESGATKEEQLMANDLDSRHQGSLNRLNDTENTPELQFVLDGNTSIEDIEVTVINKGLILRDGNVTETARLLGISREKLRYRMKKHGISV